MIRIESNIPKVIQWLDALGARMRGVVGAILRDARWGSLARETAEQALASNGCPPAWRQRILATLQVGSGPKGTWSVWRLTVVIGLIHQAIQIATQLATRPAKGRAGTPPGEQYLFGFTGQRSEIVDPSQATVHRLRQVAGLPNDEEGRVLQAAEELVRTWVYEEKDLTAYEHANPEAAVEAVLGVMGLRGASDPESLRDLWGGILSGARAEGFIAGAMSETQSDAAGRLAGMIGTWVAEGGATPEALERANPSGAEAAKELLAMATGDMATSSDPSDRQASREQLADWVSAVAVGWMAMLAVELPRAAREHVSSEFAQLGAARP